MTNYIDNAPAMQQAQPITAFDFDSVVDTDAFKPQEPQKREYVNLTPGKTYLATITSADPSFYNGRSQYIPQNCPTVKVNLDIEDPDSGQHVQTNSVIYLVGPESKMSFKLSDMLHAIPAEPGQSYGQYFKSLPGKQVSVIIGSWDKQSHKYVDRQYTGQDGSVHTYHNECGKIQAASMAPKQQTAQQQVGQELNADDLPF